MEAPEVSENIPEKSYLIKKVGDLKVLPFVARKMLDTMGDENCSPWGDNRKGPDINSTGA
jgi:hypothetical protein